MRIEQYLNGMYIEIFFTIVVTFLCLKIFYRTKEIYELTKHDGINFFRKAFLFFGISYITRLLFFLLIILQRTISPEIKIFHPIIMIIPIGIFSTLAILFLTYNKKWNNFNKKQFTQFSILVSIIFTFIALFYRAPIALAFLQMLLFIYAIIVAFHQYRKSKKHSTIFFIYLGLFFFWIFNNFALMSKHFWPLEIKIVLHSISTIIFIFVYNKVQKWVK